MKRLIYLVVLLFCYSCGTGNKKFRIAVSANAYYPMKKISSIFAEKTGIDVEIISTSSGKLYNQIKNGAPYSLFFSANMKYPEKLLRDKEAFNKVLVYVKGTLILWSFSDRIKITNLESLLHDNIKKIVIANPMYAPYGKAAVQMFKKAGIYEKIEKKIVYAGNISKVNLYIVSRNVDIGISAKSSLFNPKLKERGSFFELDRRLYKPIKQGMVITKYGYKNYNKLSKRFYSFVDGTIAKKVFREYGYVIDGEYR